MILGVLGPFLLVQNSLHVESLMEEACDIIDTPLSLIHVPFK